MINNMIELISDDGKEVFEILLRFRFKGTDYIALRPEKEDEDSAAVFEVKKLEHGEEKYFTITDENSAKEVFVHFISIWELTEDEE